MLASGTIITPELRDDWLAERGRLIGASDAYGVVRKPLELFLRKTGRLPPVEETEAMHCGNLLESLVCAEYELRTGHAVTHRQEFVRHADHPSLAATLDGRKLADGTPVEIKVVGKWMAHEFGEGETDEVPERYLLQCQHQMMVTGAARMELFAFLAGDLRFRLFRVARSEALCGLLLERELEFLECLRADTPPPRGAEHDPRLVAALYPDVDGWVALDHEHARAASEYQALGREVGRLQAARDAKKAFLLEAMGNAASADLPDGRSLVRGRVGVKEHTVKASSYVTIRVKEPVR